MNKTPIDYAELACEALMHRYAPDELPPEKILFYHQGVFLSGMENVYRLTKNKKYFKYIKKYVDSCISADGEVYGISYEVTELKNDDGLSDWVKKNAIAMLDCKQPVILLYNLYQETGEEKYRKAIETISKSMYYWPVNVFGGYWHMMTQHNQMWMDGAYMAGPLSVMYSHYFNDECLRERAINQIIIMDEHIKDEKTGLYFHGWDASFEAGWADKKTGCSKEIWGRAVGWYAVAILDMLDYIPNDHEKVKKLEDIVISLLKTLANYCDEKTGCWYQVLDKPYEKGNWIESSATCLFIYSYAKAIRKGLISKVKYGDILNKAYKGMIDSLYYDEEGYLVIDNVCIGTCIEDGTYEYYINRDTVKNDLHGAGAFILMCAEMERFNKLDEGEM